MTLRFRISIILLAVALMTAGVIGYHAYQISNELLKEQAVRSVGILADERRDVLVSYLTRQKNRATAFLNHSISVCQKKIPCLRRSLSEFIEIEQILGAELIVEKSSPIRVGLGTENMSLLQWRSDKQIAIFPSENLGVYFLKIKSERGRSSIVLQFKTHEINKIFSYPARLSKSGEVFLTDSRGFFISPPRYPEHSGQSHGIEARPMKKCLSRQNGEVLDPDYRNIGVIHGFRFVPEIGGGCIMAHIEQTEAFAPAYTLRHTMLILIVIFGVVTLVIALLSAHLLSRPVLALTSRVKNLEKGDFDSEIPFREGPLELRMLARSFSSMAKSLKHSMQLRDDFVSIVSHDLKNPLSAIIISSTLAKKSLSNADDANGNENEKQLRSHFDRILQSAHQMNQLIGDLLDIAKIQSGHFDLEVKKENLSTIINEVVELYRPLANEKQIRLLHHSNDSNLQGYCDRGRIYQALSNLIGNAVKFTSAGGYIRVALSDSDNEMKVQVQDTGAGIPSEDLDHIFDRYWQAKATRRQGTGLGLFITKAIIEAHGGWICVESKVGHGSKFIFGLPTEHKTKTAKPHPKDSKKTSDDVGIFSVQNSQP